MKESAALSQWASRIQDLSPVVREIAGVLEDAAQRAFRDEQDPVTGPPWAAASLAQQYVR